MAGIVKGIEELTWRFYYYSSDAIISRKIRRLKGKKTSCDLGCGDGTMMSRLKAFDTQMEPTLGMDIHFPTLQGLKNKNIYRWIICADLKHLPLKDKAFDVAIASHVVEHIEKEAKVFQQLERVARKLVIVGVPRGMTKFSPHEEEEENIYQRHRSGYEVEDFRKSGFQVFGFGSRFICNRAYKEGKIPQVLRPAFSFLSQIATAFTYYLPAIADCFICIKYAATDKNEK
jgi:hypothetical protein